MNPTTAKYFVKRTEAFRIISIVMISIGALLMTLEITIQFDTWAVMSAGVMLTAAGAAIYAFDNGKRLKDSELDEIVRNAVSAMPAKIERKTAENRIRVRETARDEFTAFEPDADGALSKKGKDGAVRASRLSYTAVIRGITDKRPGTLIYKNSFSITDDYESDSAVLISDEDLSSAELVTDERRITTVTGETLRYETAKIRLVFAGGETEFKVRNDASAEDLLNTMKRLCAKNRT